LVAGKDHPSISLYRFCATQDKAARVSDTKEADIIIAGGGLSGGLIALALRQKRPDLSILLIEAKDMLGGNHVWSFFDSDISTEGKALLSPLVSHRWEGGHDVRFPDFARTLALPYNSITSTQFDAHIRAVMGRAVLTNTPISALTPTSITLKDGRTLRAHATIDARGFTGSDDPALRAISCGWQKFVGQSLRLTAPHGLTRPIIMDASVEQTDGYRFIYVLPLSSHDVFIEDTYYSDTPELNVPEVRQRIGEYAEKTGWTVATPDPATNMQPHEETGVLPVVMNGDFNAFWPADTGPARAGVKAGLFHPTTGYSIAEAVRYALALADSADLDGTALARWSREYAHALWGKGNYYRLLDTMLFRAARPSLRYRIFARFYRLNEHLIGRFYSGQSTFLDKIRILCGKPPVPIRDAMVAIWKREGK
jgi:lycopene beta-cyclase